eukprot:GHVU01198798.1.p1 GENE.GHVU01198798.1~~GHVU01198798.1.p1  ORF type:complete len:180 (-),score=19.86 GHVU01198798.1:1542-2081(-)
MGSAGHGEAGDLHRNQRMAAFYDFCEQHLLKLYERTSEDPDFIALPVLGNYETAARTQRPEEEGRPEEFLQVDEAYNVCGRAITREVYRTIGGGTFAFLFHRCKLVENGNLTPSHTQLGSMSENALQAVNIDATGTISACTFIETLQDFGFYPGFVDKKIIRKIIMGYKQSAFPLAVSK